MDVMNRPREDFSSIEEWYDYQEKREDLSKR
jgi:hypothetical protein